MAQTKTITDWETEDLFWRDQYKNRPYGIEKGYDYWQPAYRYGFESAQRYQDQNKTWSDVEGELRSGWDRYERRDPQSTWGQVKDAVRDAWNRVMGR